MIRAAGAMLGGAPPPGGTPPRVAPRLDQARAVVAIGDAQRERLILQLFADAAADGVALRVTRRCLDADELLGSIHEGEAEVAVVDADLHGLGADTVHRLVQLGVPLLLWGTTSAIADDLSDHRAVVVLAGEAGLPELRAALVDLAHTGGRLRRPAAVAATLPRPPTTDAPPQARLRAATKRHTGVAGMILVLLGAPGGQGVSTQSTGLATAFSQHASAALVDFDLRFPSLALALDLNPARNLYMVLHEAGTRADSGLWSRLLEAELQPLDARLPLGAVLAGAPGSNLAAAMQPEGARQVLRQLAVHYRYVVVDAGSTLEATGPAATSSGSAGQQRCSTRCGRSSRIRTNDWRSS